jgi:hypothetical protein
MPSDHCGEVVLTYQYSTDQHFIMHFVSESIDPINASQQPQTVTLHVLTQCEFELARKTLSQLVNSHRQPIHITKYWQILVQRHGYPLQDFFGGTSNAGTTKNKKFK